MGQTLVIDVDFPRFEITYKTLMGSTKDVLLFGKETTIVTSDSRKQRLTIRSDGDSIVTTTKVSLNRGVLEHRYRMSPTKMGLFVEMKMSHRNGKTASCSRFYKRRGK